MSKRPRNGLQALQNADAQSTITLEIAAWVRNRSRKSASNLQHRKYQDLIRGSLAHVSAITPAGAEVGKNYCEKNREYSNAFCDNFQP